MGNNNFILKEKFKKLRERLRWWNHEVFGWLDLKIKENVELLNELEDDYVCTNR